MKDSFPDSFRSRWGPAGLFTILIPFLAGHRLDHENDNAEREWNPVDIVVPVG